MQLDPRRFMQILHLPLRLIRLVTDPVVDTLIMLITQGLLPPIGRAACKTSSFFVNIVGVMVGHGRTTKLVHFSKRLVSISTLTIS